MSSSSSSLGGSARRRCRRRCPRNRPGGSPEGMSALAAPSAGDSRGRRHAVRAGPDRVAVRAGPPAPRIARATLALHVPRHPRLVVLVDIVVLLHRERRARALPDAATSERDAPARDSNNDADAVEDSCAWCPIFSRRRAAREAARSGPVDDDATSASATSRGAFTTRASFEMARRLARRVHVPSPAPSFPPPRQSQRVERRDARDRVE